ncbi:MAG: hypothetical protein ACRDTR_12745, partial [Rubrobacter sp.]
DIEAVADTVGIIKEGRLLVSGNLDGLRETHKVLRVVYAQTPSDEEVSGLRTTPGVAQAEKEGRGVRLRVCGDVEEVQRSLQASSEEVRDVDVVGMGLEDIFVAYVEEGEGGH